MKINEALDVLQDSLRFYRSIILAREVFTETVAAQDIHSDEALASVRGYLLLAEVLEERLLELEAGVVDAVTVIEKIANGASRSQVEPKFSRFRNLILRSKK